VPTLKSYYHPHVMFLLQTDLLQYEMCDCNAEGVENPDCQVSTTTRQVCQDEVLLKITVNSNELTSALSFELGMYYLISEFPMLDNCSQRSLQKLVKCNTQGCLINRGTCTLYNDVTTLTPIWPWLLCYYYE
jgi:hypothetical protein